MNIFQITKKNTQINLKMILKLKMMKLKNQEIMMDNAYIKILYCIMKKIFFVMMEENLIVFVLYVKLFYHKKIKNVNNFICLLFKKIY